MSLSDKMKKKLEAEAKKRIQQKAGKYANKYTKKLSDKYLTEADIKKLNEIAKQMGIQADKIDFSSAAQMKQLQMELTKAKSQAKRQIRKKVRAEAKNRAAQVESQLEATLDTDLDLTNFDPENLKKQSEMIKKAASKADSDRIIKELAKKAGVKGDIDPEKIKILAKRIQTERNLDPEKVKDLVKKAHIKEDLDPETIVALAEKIKIQEARSKKTDTKPATPDVTKPANKVPVRKSGPQAKQQQALRASVKTEASIKYSLLDEIKKSPLNNQFEADAPARRYIRENCSDANKQNIVPGQMLVFQYFEPKTKEDLEYYDASPCTIFFGVFNSTQGKRVLGFNIHYYPPKIRKRVLNKIFEIYKPVYLKYFNTGIVREIDAFDYKYLIDALEKAKLSFGVRMYIPQLIGKTWVINPNQWVIAAYTEGWFKKRTKVAILNYWRKFKGK